MQVNQTWNTRSTRLPYDQSLHSSFVISIQVSKINVIVRKTSENNFLLCGTIYCLFVLWGANSYLVRISGQVI